MDQELQGFHLSPQQRQLWHAAPEGGLPPAVIRLELSGELDPARLERAFFAVAERHEILTTAFRRPAGLVLPLQYPGAIRPHWERLDLSAESAERQNEVLEERFAELSTSRPLLDGPPPQALLVDLGSGRWTFVVSASPLALDGVGLDHWVDTLAAACDALASGIAVEEPMLQYVQYADWQNAIAEELGEAVAPPAAQAPRSGARWVVEGTDDETSWNVQQNVERKLIGAASQLAAVAAQLGVTPEAIPAAAWSLLLERLGGAQDEGLPLAVNLDGRAVADELIGAVGCCAAARWLEGSAPVGLRFADRVRRLDAAFGEALEESLPEIALAAAAGGRAAGLPAGFTWHRAPAERQGAGARWQVIQRTEPGVPSRCLLKVEERGDDLLLGLRWSGESLAPAVAERLLGQAAGLLTVALETPEAPSESLPSFAPGEREELLETFQGRKVSHGTTAHGPFFAHAAGESEAPAVVGETPWTYGELAHRALALASELRRRGIGREDRVAVLTGRTPELPVAVLGVLRAGAAYVPLDPADPAERRSYILKNSAPRAILATAETAASLEHDPAVELLVLDAAAEPAQTSDELPEWADAESAAYVIYTSGSTGRPKGVVVPHGGLANYLAFCGETYPVGPGTTAAVHSPVGFDLAVTSILAPLVSGGALDLVAEDTAAGDVLAETLETRGFHFLKLTPGHLGMLSNLLQDDHLARAARTVVLGGEALLGAHLERWRELAPELRVINEYGPTEAAVGCSIYEMPAGAPAAGAVPIGGPIPNARLYVVDENFEPCPAGLAGELLIGGGGLARGYLGRPALTAERFVPDPFSPSPGGRMYRTGDVVLHHPGQGLVYRGRNDDQVKVRGVRVELGEVESVLAEQPGVQQAAADVRDGRLLAWLVVDAEVAPSAEAVLEGTARRLPAAMVPSRAMVLDTLPRASSGKVDRRALEEVKETSSSGAGRQPSSPAERQLADIWCRVLGLEGVGLDDNFFELGGDSILSTQVVYRAAQAGWKITARDMVQQTDLAQLAAIAEPLDAAEQTVDEGLGEAPLTPIQRWFFDLELEERSQWNQALWLESAEPLDRDRLSAAVDRLRRRHPALGSHFEEAEGAWGQRIEAPQEEVPLTFHALMVEDPSACRQEIEGITEELQASLDLQSGPLFRVASFDLGPGEPQRLLLVIHHLVVDGVSWRVLLEDLLEEYHAGVDAPQAPPMGTSYRRWADRLAAHSDSGAFTQEMPFWLAQGATAGERLPRDRELGPATEASAHSVVRGLDREETRRLLEDVHGAYRTRVDDLLLTALSEVLCRFTRRESVVVELEGHGREPLFDDLEVGRTVGWFTTLFPVRLAPGARPEASARIKALKEQLRSVPGKGIGYGLLRHLGPEADRAKLAALGQPEVSFNYLGRFQQDLPEGFAVLEQSVGPVRHPGGLRSHALTITAGVFDDRLDMTWTFSKNLHSEATVERLAEAFLRELRELMTHCLDRLEDSHDVGATPSDFPEAGLDQADLEDFLAEVEGTLV